MKTKFKSLYFNLIKFPSYIIFHPFDGYDELKRYKKGKPWVATLFIVLFAFFRIFVYVNESIIINNRNPHNLNTIQEIFTVLLLIFLFVVGNWSITTLMEGKGNMKEIFMVTGYSLFPVLIIGFPSVILSNYLTKEEMGIYTLLMGSGYALTGIMLFFGILNIHEYGLLKTILTFLFTVVAMLFMIFLGLLFFDLIQQFIAFIISIYDELRLRY